MEERIKNLEDQFLSTNKKIQDLTDRVLKVELLLHQGKIRPNVDQHAGHRTHQAEDVESTTILSCVEPSNGQSPVGNANEPVIQNVLEGTASRLTQMQEDMQLCTLSDPKRTNLRISLQETELNCEIQGTATKHENSALEISSEIAATGSSMETSKTEAFDLLHPALQSKTKTIIPSVVSNNGPSVLLKNPWGDDLDDIPWAGTEIIKPSLVKKLDLIETVRPVVSFVKQSYLPCKKLCGLSTGHPCGVMHDPSLTCPPCTTLMKNLKLKCSHRVDVLCHRQGKIRDLCSECDAKRLAKEQPSELLSKPTCTLTMDPLRSESELEFRKVRDVLCKLTSANFDALAGEFTLIVSNQTKFLPEIAAELVERAIIDVEKPLAAANFAKLIWKAINNPHGELKMFRIEIVTIVITIFSNLLKLPGASDPPFYVKTLFLRKEISEMDLRRKNLGMLRFVGELFNHDVISLSNLQNDVVNALLAQPSEENLDYVCKLLTLVGHNIQKKVTATESEKWFEDIFLKLRIFSERCPSSSTVRVAVENLLGLREADWDRYKKITSTALTVATSVTVADSTNSVLSNGSATGSNTVDSASSTKKRSRKKKVKTCNEAALIDAEPQARKNSDVFDPWENAPWGEHADPLAVAFPQLDSPGFFVTDPNMMSNSSIAAPSWKGSQSSVSAHKTVSNSSSRLISPAQSVSSIASSKSALPPEIDALSIFNSYQSIYSKPESERVKLLERKLSSCEEKQLRDFIRALSRHISKVSARQHLAMLGTMIDILIKRQIVSEDMVMKGFTSGIVSDLPLITKDQPLISDRVANVVVTIWGHRMTNFDWLVTMGKSMYMLYPHTWHTFCKEVLRVLVERKKDAFVRKCFEDTSTANESLLKSARELNIWS